MVAAELGDGVAPADEVPAAVALFRQQYRAEHIGPSYSGWLHFAFTSVGSLAAVGFALARVRSPTALELAVVPLTLVFANFVEYRGHRGPLHHRRRGLALLFERHTQQHHRYYTHEAMAFEASRDFKVVLFPPVMLVFFLGVIAMPVALALSAFVSRNAAMLFVATAVGYFLLYEWLHFCHHMPEHGAFARSWLLRRLRAHHQAHHDLARMRSGNFNITFPLCDWLFGTIIRAPRS